VEEDEEVDACCWGPGAWAAIRRPAAVLVDVGLLQLGFYKITKLLIYLPVILCLLALGQRESGAGTEEGVGHGDGRSDGGPGLGRGVLLESNWIKDRKRWRTMTRTCAACV
jgi:hypothetical protein